MDFEQNYRKNMQFLEKAWPKIYKEVEAADISLYSLEKTPTGEYNILVNSHKLYPDDVDNAIEQQVDFFLKDPSCFVKKPTWNLNSDMDYVHDDLLKKIEYTSPFMAYSEKFNGYYHNIKKYFPFILFMGIGSGVCLQKLIQKAKDIKEIIIVDESYEMLKISFHLIDWIPIFEYFYKSNKGLYFIITDKPKVATSSVLNTIYKHYPYQFYYLPYYINYNSNFFTEFREDFLSRVDLGFTGLGYFDDEIIGLTHSMKNLNTNHPVYRFKKELPKNSSAFIIASGPSIDNDIEEIKKQKDKAIIFSCGTALKILYENGITPDYHLEAERTLVFLGPLVENIPKEYLKKINFIGLNVIHPKVFEVFKSGKIFFRLNDAGSSIIPNDIPKLDHCNPTVTNAALSFASDIGFHNIYLFGTDMGFRDAEHHHSKSSAYYEDKSNTINNTKLNVNRPTYQGNFDKEEKLLSTDIFIWCKQRVENCIIDYNFKQFKDINYFNCSDGLLIEGTKSLRSTEIKLPDELDKRTILEAIENSFDSDFEHLHKEIKQIFLKEKNELLGNITSIRKLIKAKEITSFEQLFVLFDRTFRLVTNIPRIEESYLTRSILRGTMYHTYNAIYTHALATADKQQALTYINNSLKLYLEFLDLAHSKIKSMEF